MKTLKFSPELVKLIQDGLKTTTWRLFDDKDIREGDELTFIKRPELVPFAQAVVLSVTEKRLKDLNDFDKEGHEDVGTNENMYRTYNSYYKEEITPETKVKVIKFRLLN